MEHGVDRLTHRFLPLAVCAALAAGLELTASAGLATEAVQDAIVKIYTVSQGPDYYNPWNMLGITSFTGSGAIISGHRILTNAHVVSNQRLVQVRRNGDPERHLARLLAISHEADLALLTVDEPAFFEDVTPLPLGGLPSPQQEVLVYGFPMGGDMLSITKGVISRIEHQMYAHSSQTFLAAQIDAAINPGNSGGPVMVEGKLVGVAMQVYGMGENLGYLVPVSMVEHFLADMEDGRYDGFPSLGVLWQAMENPDLKRKYKMPAGRSGILILSVVPGSSVGKQLLAGDVLLALDGHVIADDGTVEFRPRERTLWKHYLDEQQIGGVLPFELLREGKVLNVRITLTASRGVLALVPPEQYDRVPSYFIYGGLVFSTLTKNYLQAWGGDWYRSAPSPLLALMSESPHREGEEVVILVKVLAAPVSEGYHEMGNNIIEKVNGRKILNLKDLIRAVDENAGSPFVTFVDSRGQEVVLDRAKVRASQAEILATYHVNADRSPDLAPEGTKPR